jgi:hypothetical protein
MPSTGNREVTTVLIGLHLQTQMQIVYLYKQTTSTKANLIFLHHIGG